jgi:hypothetical protein
LSLRGQKEAKLTAQQMTLQVLRVQVGFVAVRARKLAIGILGGNGGALCGAIDTVGHRGRAARNTRQNATAALRAHDLRAWLILRRSVRRAIGAIHVGSHTPGLAIGVAESTGRHAIEIPTVARGSRSNGLRVALRGRRGRQHTWRRRVRLVVMVLCLMVRVGKVRR